MAWNLLFNSDYGLMSLLTIFCVIGIGVFMWRFFRRQVLAEEGAAAPAQDPAPRP
jgi:hypothetical protein